MKILKKRSVAIIIVLIIAIVFTFIGVDISVNRQAQKIEDMFYTGVKDETALQTNLDNIYKEAKVIYSIAEEYLGSDIPKAFRIAYNDLYEAKSISKKYDCYETLMSELALLYPLMEEGVDNSYDEIYMATHKESLDNLKLMMERSSYNTKVQEFEDTILNSFPINLIKGIMKIDTPEYFA